MTKFTAAVFKRKARKVERGGKTVTEDRDQYMPYVAQVLEKCGWFVELIETDHAAGFIPRLEMIGGTVSLVVCAPPILESKEFVSGQNLTDHLAEFSEIVSKRPGVWLLHVSQGHVEPQIFLLEKTVSLFLPDEYIDTLKTPTSLKRLMKETLDCLTKRQS